VKPYTRGKRHADEIMAREQCRAAPLRRRGYAVRSNQWLRRYQHKQARQQARRAARAVERGDELNDDA
jgi:hypothetical protein